MDFELHRNDFHTSRFLYTDPPSPDDGEALLRVESFGLTSNNITYAVFGEAMNYWDFFPASGPEWGKLNVWGYARVEIRGTTPWRQACVCTATCRALAIC